MAVALLGASGYTGRLVARALDRRGVAFVAAGRDRRRVEEAVDGLAQATGVRVADATDRGSLDAAFAGAEVVVTTVGPFVDLGRPVLESAVANGCHYVDSTGEQRFMRWAFGEQQQPATSAGIAAVPACGFDYVPGDLLSEVAARAVGQPAEVHVVYLVRGGGVSASRGTRRTIARIAGDRGVSFVDGRFVEEGTAQERRLAWFPKPVGPHTSASLPGGEPLTVPRHLPSARTVRTYLAVPGPLAELLQFGANLARWGPAARLFDRLLSAGPEGPSDRDRRSQRFAAIAEVVGTDGSLARAWMTGRDVYGFTAEAMALVADRLRRGDVGARGVVAPAEVGDAEALLDELSDVAGVRWSVKA